MSGFLEDYHDTETDVPYDHTSIMKTILKWQGIKPESSLGLGKRMLNAPTFENVLTKEARSDDVVNISLKFGEFTDCSAPLTGLTRDKIQQLISYISPNADSKEAAKLTKEIIKSSKTRADLHLYVKNKTAKLTRVKIKNSGTGHYLRATSLENNNLISCQGEGELLEFYIVGDLNKAHFGLKQKGEDALYLSYRYVNGEVKLYDSLEDAYYQLIPVKGKNNVFNIKNIKYNDYIWLDGNNLYVSSAGQSHINDSQGQWEIEGLCSA